MEIKYLNTDKTKILFEQMAYSKYKDANFENEVTWRCPQCKFITLKTDDCGLFACAYLELLSQAQDPANYTFNQAKLRAVFNNYLVSNSFDGFGGVCHGGVPNVHRLTIDWAHTWSDR
jgi:hypothetical protein